MDDRGVFILEFAYLGEGSSNFVNRDELVVRRALAHGARFDGCSDNQTSRTPPGIVPGVVFSSGERSLLSASLCRHILRVLILHGCNVPGRIPADFTGFGKSSPSFASTKIH